MPSFEAVTPQRHAKQSWQPSPDYRFAAQDSVATLVAAELPEACMHLPLGFSRVGEAETFVPVALQGVRSGQNLWVDGQGHWRGGYIPAVYRSYPFALGRADEKHVLCVNRDSGLIREDGTGEPFFQADDKPVERISRIMEFLSRIRASAEATKTQCAALATQGLIQPWSLQVTVGEQTQTLQGLYRVDENALNALPAEAFDTLRQTGVLPMIYCQLLSMRHIHQLGALAGAGRSAPQPARANGKDPEAGVAGGDNLDLDFLNHTTIRFN